MILYKYLPPPRIDVLQNQFIRCTPAFSQNDIFEMRPYFDKIIDPSQTEDLFSGIKLDLDKISREIIDQLPNNLSKNLSIDLVKKRLENYFTTEDGEIYFQNLKNDTISFMNRLTPKFQEKINKELPKLVGIISFSENCNSNLMWAHYTDNHKGFIIGFDGKHSFFKRKRNVNDELNHLRKVKYDEVDKINSLYGTNGIDFLSRKHSEWKYEQEWRILFLLRDADKVLKNKNEEIHLFSFPKESIKSIIFGVKTTERQKEKIYKVIEEKKYNHLKIGKMFIDNNERKINVNWIR